MPSQLTRFTLLLATVLLILLRVQRAWPRRRLPEGWLYRRPLTFRAMPSDAPGLSIAKMRVFRVPELLGAGLMLGLLGTLLLYVSRGL